MRLFFAIPLPKTLKDELADFQARARKTGLSASWPNPKDLHLTLAFLGEQDVSRMAALMEIAGPVAARHPRFMLKTSVLGGFPSDRSARVLWLGLEEQSSLRTLAGDLREGLRAAGVDFDEKPFKAHLTLARAKAPLVVSRFGEPPAPVAFMVRELTLFQSLPSQGGVRYVSRGSAPLAGEAAG